MTNQNPWLGDQLSARVVTHANDQRWFDLADTCRDLGTDVETARELLHGKLRGRYIEFVQPGSEDGPVQLVVSETGLYILLLTFGGFTPAGTGWREWYDGEALPAIKAALPLIRAAKALGVFGTALSDPFPYDERVADQAADVVGRWAKAHPWKRPNAEGSSDAA